MKIKTFTTALTLFATLATGPASAAWPLDLGSWALLAEDYLESTEPLAGNGNTMEAGVVLDPVPVLVPLNPEEESTLVFMREEEKMARDVYLVLFDQWGLPVFENIALRSEQEHMQIMLDMLRKYGIPDPVVDDTVGMFVNADLADLYRNLVERGMNSLEDALMVGALIEEVDILDLMRAIEEADDHPDLVQAYENLMLGSRNHLRAFVGQLESLGIVYQAQLMDAEMVEEIINSPMERGNGTGNAGGATKGVNSPGTYPQDDTTQGGGTTPASIDNNTGFNGFNGLSGFGGSTGNNGSDQLCVGVSCLF